MHRFFHVAPRLLGTALCLAFASQASAQQDEWDDRSDPFVREGIYAGLGGLYALENFDRDAAIAGDALEIGAGDGGGFEMRGGYRMHPNFAGEVLFQWYSGFSVNDRVSGENDHFNGWSLTANAKGYPLLGRIQPYAVVGIGALVFNEKRGNDHSFVARMGGGIDVFISDAVVLDLEIVYVFPAGPLDDYQFTTFAAGIQYRY